MSPLRQWLINQAVWFPSHLQTRSNYPQYQVGTKWCRGINKMLSSRNYETILKKPWTKLKKILRNRSLTFPKVRCKSLWSPKKFQINSFKLIKVYAIKSGQHWISQIKRRARRCRACSGRLAVTHHTRKVIVIQIKVTTDGENRDQPSVRNLYIQYIKSLLKR